MAGINIQLTLGGIQAAQKALEDAASVLNQSQPTMGSWNKGRFPNYMGGDFQNLQMVRDQRRRNELTTQNPLVAADLATKEWRTTQNIRRTQHQMRWGWLDNAMNNLTRFNRALFFSHQALKIITGGFEEFAKPVRELSHAVINAGGASGLFGYAGDPGEHANAANAFRNARATDAWAMMAFGPQMDVRAGGPQNTGAQLAAAVEKLSRINDPNARLLAARRGGLENYLDASYANPALRHAYEREGFANARRVELNRPANANIDAVRQYGSTQWQAAGQHFYQAMEGFRTIGAGLSAFGGWLTNGGAFALQSILNPVASIREGWDAFHGGGATTGSDNTQAMNDLAAAIKDLGRELRGPRGRAAVPEALQNGIRLQHALESGSIKMGGIAL